MIYNKPKAIIFDWDDTLASTREAVVEAMEYVLKKYNKETWDVTKIKYRDTKKSLKENFVNFFGTDAAEAYKCYLDYYQEKSFSKVAPIKDANSFLSFCKSQNIELYIISNKEKLLLLKEVKHSFPDVFFKKILGNGDAKKNKPAADPVFETLKDANYPINKQNVWLVGDTKQDTECAYNAGVLPILMGKGKFMEDNYIKNKASSSDPLLMFNNFKELNLAVEEIIYHGC